VVREYLVKDKRHKIKDLRHKIKDKALAKDLVKVQEDSVKVMEELKEVIAGLLLVIKVKIKIWVKKCVHFRNNKKGVADLIAVFSTPLALIGLVTNKTTSKCLSNKNHNLHPKVNKAKDNGVSHSNNLSEAPLTQALGVVLVEPKINNKQVGRNQLGKEITKHKNKTMVNNKEWSHKILDNSNFNKLTIKSL